ncbi:MAG: xanthine dehydrogenase family protein molybdopterin-binding subunit [Sediminibacterium sp.]
MFEPTNHFNIVADDERADAAEKVTGRAKFTADHHIDNIAYGLFVCSSIAKGTITNLDSSKALQAPGVLDVIYYKNCPNIPGYNALTPDNKRNNFEWKGLKVLNDNIVRFFGQPIALVVADSFENALAAVKLVKAEYATEAFDTNFNEARLVESKTKLAGKYKRGNPKAYLNAPFFIEAEYNTPIEVHNPMEMHSSIAIWEGDDKLTLYDKSQGPKGTQSTIARTFGIPEKNVRVITEFVGGAFGNALRSWLHVPAACIAAKKLNRPVKVLLTRPQMFSLVGYRPQSWQKIGIGADKTGKLLGISHEAISNTSRYEDFREGITDASRFLYKCENVDTEYKLLPLDLSTPTWMRGPGETTGCFALESALDELSYQLKMDPIDLRIVNYTETHQENKLPWSANNVKDCYAAGKEKIGWKNRPKKPGSLKEKGWLVGYGMGGGIFGANKGSATVKAILKEDGGLVLQSAVSDMGPGTTTAMGIIAAESLKMPTSRIKFMLGDSSLPPGPTQGGSGTTSTLGSAVNLICETLKQVIKELGIQHFAAFKGLQITDLEVKNELLIDKKNQGSQISIVELLKLAGKPSIEITKESNGNNPQEIKYAFCSFSVHFVKILVHPKTGEMKLQKVITTGDAGKIISENTARSQMLGGVVGGIGMAFKEGLEINHATGEIANASFGEYLVPRHTDIPETEIWFVNKPDPFINSIGAKGIGEIAMIGFAAAVANAVYNATGKRVRDLPITPEKLGFSKA